MNPMKNTKPYVHPFQTPGEGAAYSTPHTAKMITLLGTSGTAFFNGVLLSKQEIKALDQFYGEHTPSGTEAEALHVAGHRRDVLRISARDGLRVMAFLARYLEKGVDPVKTVARMLTEAGCDVPNDQEWIWADPDWGEGG